MANRALTYKTEEELSSSSDFSGVVFSGVVVVLAIISGKVASTSAL